MAISNVTVTVTPPTPGAESVITFEFDVTGADHELFTELYVGVAAAFGVAGLYLDYDPGGSGPEYGNGARALGGDYDPQAFVYEGTDLGGTPRRVLKYPMYGGTGYGAATDTLLDAPGRGSIAISGFTNPAAGSYPASSFGIGELLPGDGVLVAPSSAVVIANTPGAPAITGITPGDQQLTVAFTAPGSDGGSAVTTYQYSTDGGSTWRTRQTGTTASPLVITTLSSDGTTALTNGVTYAVQIRAVNVIGSGTATGSTNGTPAAAQAPGAPTLGSVSAGDAQLSAAFSAPASDGGAAITTYQYSTDNGVTWRTRLTGTTDSPLVITRLSSDGTTALVNGTTYTVRVRAVNSVGAGTASGSGTGTPVADPRGSITAFNIPAGSVQVFNMPVGSITAFDMPTGSLEVFIQ